MINWLEQLTSLVTVAGAEEEGVDWVRRWVARRPDLRLVIDRGGNMVITQRRRSRQAPVWMTAHLDHPGFILTEELGSDRFSYEFRGGVLDPYFEDAPVHFFGASGRRSARVETTERTGRDRTGVVRLSKSGPPLTAGDLGRWAFSANQLGIRAGLLHAPACDDLAGVAAALAALDGLRKAPDSGHVGVLLTRAEEVGFIGAIAAARDGTIAAGTRLVCIEMSRSYPDSPIGGGPVVRVGDASSVFSPRLTGMMAAAGRDLAELRTGFRFQRKLMPGGSCEATAFAAYGFESTCLCLPLGNYHNMGDLSAVEAGIGAARPRPEVISVDDYRGLVALLIRSVGNLESETGQLRTKLDDHYLSYQDLLSR